MEPNEIKQIFESLKENPQAHVIGTDRFVSSFVDSIRNSPIANNQVSLQCAHGLPNTAHYPSNHNSNKLSANVAWLHEYTVTSLMESIPFQVITPSKSAQQ